MNHPVYAIFRRVLLWWMGILQGRVHPIDVCGALFFEGMSMAEFVVTTLADTIANDGQVSLREALAQANATTGTHRISFAEGLSGEINLTSHLSVAANKTVTIDGDTDNDGDAEIALDGQGTTRHLDIAANATVTIDTLQLIGGRMVGAVGASTGIAENGAAGDDKAPEDNANGDNGQNGTPGGEWPDWRARWLIDRQLRQADAQERLVSFQQQLWRQRRPGRIGWRRGLRRNRQRSRRWHR